MGQSTRKTGQVDMGRLYGCPERVAEDRIYTPEYAGTFRCYYIGLGETFEYRPRDPTCPGQFKGLHMATNKSDAGDEDEESSELWNEVGKDVKALFGEDVDVTVKDYSNHIDVRIVPNGAVAELEDEHEELTVVPYNACQLTIRKESNGVDGENR